MNPDVSIIVPCFNYGHFLPETLTSVLNQSLYTWECLIIDDGSTDNTKEVAHQFINADKRFVYFYQENKGLSAARNKGIELSKGRFLQFLDADDMLEQDKLMVHCNFLKENKACDIAFGDALFFEDINNERKLTTCPYPNETQDYPTLLKDFTTALVIKNRIPPCAPVVRKDLFNQINNFDESLFSLEDWDLWLRCSLKGRSFHYVNKENSNALVRQSPNSMRKNLWKMSLYEIKVRNKIQSFLNIEQTKVNKKIIKDRLKTALYEMTSHPEKTQREKQLTKLRELTNLMKLRMLSFLFRLFPKKYHTKLVWILFESPLNMLKSKLNA